MGILSVIRMTEPDLNTLALGTDLTSLGLNLNSADSLYATFASPWADARAQRAPEGKPAGRSTEPRRPISFLGARAARAGVYAAAVLLHAASGAEDGRPLPRSPGSRGREIARDYARVRWGTGHFSKFQLETLFYIFYNMPRDTLQESSAEISRAQPSSAVISRDQPRSAELSRDQPSSAVISRDQPSCEVCPLSLPRHFGCNPSPPPRHRCRRTLRPSCTTATGGTPPQGRIKT